MPAAPRLKKRYGQHHLRHPGLCRPLIEFLRPAGHRVVEIGAGGGLLSGELVRAGARVWAWELDLEWAFALGRRRRRETLAVVAGDAVEVEWRRLPGPTLVAGNLPYAIATRLILELLAGGAGVPRCGFLVQLEVARRLCARPGDPDYGSLPVLVAARAEPRLLGRVDRGSFRPRPKVDGAFVGLSRRRPVLAAGAWDGFVTVVRRAFAHRRKTLRNALAAHWSRGRVEEVLGALALPAATRAAELGLEEFVALHREMLDRGLLNGDGC